MHKCLTQHLIEDGLGYCCPYAFFSLFRQTRVISARLGLGRTTVKEWKRRMKSGELQCQHCPNCMQPRFDDLQFSVKLLREEAATMPSTPHHLQRFSAVHQLPPEEPSAEDPKV